MEIKILHSTKENYIATAEEFTDIAGKVGGVCYLPGTTEELFAEDPTKTKKRAERSKKLGHQSLFDHPYFTFELNGIPKIIAMMLNNEAMYTTSEKSGRYTKMVLPEEEQTLYDKWLEIFKREITEQDAESCPKWFTERKIEKLAQENARYLTSAFTPTIMIHSVSYRQFNQLYMMFREELEKFEGKEDEFSKRLAPALKEMIEAMEKVVGSNGKPFLDALNEGLLKNAKGRALSLIRDFPVEKHFGGDDYSLSYKGSIAQYAQAHRHRTLKHGMTKLQKPEFYIPPILKSKPELVEEWKKDCLSLAPNFPQGMLVMISEQGTYEDFKLKAFERCCSGAQLEINQQTTQTAKMMAKALKVKLVGLAVKNLFTTDKEKREWNKQRALTYKKRIKVLDVLGKGGSRCKAGYQCADPCKYADGINGTRNI